jgi:hypothetical protein
MDCEDHMEVKEEDAVVGGDGTDDEVGAVSVQEDMRLLREQPWQEEELPGRCRWAWQGVGTSVVSFLSLDVDMESYTVVASFRCSFGRVAFAVVETFPSVLMINGTIWVVHWTLFFSSSTTVAHHGLKFIIFSF